MEIKNKSKKKIDTTPKGYVHLGGNMYLNNSLAEQPKQQEQQKQNYKLSMSSTPGQSSNQLICKTIERAQGSDREPSHLDSSGLPARKGQKRRSIFGYANNVISESTRLYSNETGWYDA
jgi:hypothetical protein